MIKTISLGVHGIYVYHDEHRIHCVCGLLCLRRKKFVKCFGWHVDFIYIKLLDGCRDSVFVLPTSPWNSDNVHSE